MRWNPGANNLWDAAATNWLDAGDNPVVWQPGATARFEGNGGLVNVAGDVSATNIVFAGNGYTLLGAGRLSLDGAISVAAGATNCVAAEFRTSAALTKTGPGALALTRCGTPFSVTEGTLLVSARDTSDADISVAAGAALRVFGGPATNANLVANASFETPALAAGAFSYVSGTAISNWTTATPSLIARQNTAAATVWNSAGTAPDGNHVLIVQYGGSVAQTVNVGADGLYVLSFYHFLRNGYPETPLSVSLGGARLACFMNAAVQFNHQLFVSAPLYLKAGAYALRLEGDGGQSDRANMVDLVCLAPPSAARPACALGGLSTLRAATGATVNMDFAGSAPLARVYLDGALQPAGTFTSSHSSGIFAGGGTLSSTAPENIFTWASAAGNWSEASNWESAAAPAGNQNRSLLFPFGASAAATNDIGGTFTLNRLWSSGSNALQTANLSGNPLQFTNSAAGAKPILTLSGAGTAEIVSQVDVRGDLALDNADTLTVSGALNLPLTNSYVVSKTGPGSAAVSSANNSPSCYMVYEGSLTFGGVHTGSRSLSSAGPFAGIPAAVVVNSLTNRSSAFFVTRPGIPVAQQVFFSGTGESVFGTRCGGAAVTNNTWFTGLGTAATCDVGTGDTLRIQQLIEAVNDVSIRCNTGLIKAGPGTLEVRSPGANNTTRRAYTGTTVLRNGTLVLSVDDCGTLSGVTNPFNGQSYDGRGGALGYSAFTNTVRIGDPGTLSSDTLALVANGDRRYIGHDIEILNRGSTVTLGLTAGTALFAGTITLHRDITLAGPADGVMIVSNVVAAADYAGTGLPAFSGLAGLRIEGAFPSAASLVMGARALRFGTYAARTQTLNALSLGTPTAAATLDIDFAAGANDALAVTMLNGLSLSNTVVNLTYAGTGLPFAEPGTYTLFTYAGTLGGSTSLLSVGNPQSGASYVFADDAANHRVTLTISGTSGGVGAVWKSPASGSWDTGAAWDSGNVPDNSGVVPLFGLAITNAATVAVPTARTVGGLLFNNGSFGYTLSGSGGLTFATNGATPLVSVLAGTHTLSTSLDGASGLGVSTAAGASLTLGSGALVKTDLALNAGALNLAGATAQGAFSQAAGTAVNVANTNVLSGGLSGAASAVLTFSGTAPKLTVSTSGSDTYAGSLVSSWTNSRLEKTGSGTLTLAGGLPGFNGITTVSGGTLGLRSAGLPGTVALAAPAGASVATPAVQGLMGYYFTRTPNTNDFSSLAAFNAHLANLTPDLTEISGTSSNLFDFGWTTDSKFPLPYGLGGSRTTNFEAAWLGKIRVPFAGRYRFRMYGDDGLVLGVDNVQLVARNYWADRWEEAEIDLDAGLHDILVGYYQSASGYGLKLEYTMANNPHYSYPLSNSWLVAESRIGTLSGSGPVALPDANSAFNVHQASVTEYYPAKLLTGALSGDAASAFSKSCTNQLTVTAASGFNGQFRASEGIAAVSNGLGGASLAAANANATLKFIGGTGTVGGLSGTGLISPNGAYTYTFSGDASSGISNTKTYTHKLDFPADGAPATINGVTFIAAGPSGSANGYLWSIANPPPNTYAGSGSGIAGLTSDFFHGSRDFTITLSGLTPGQAYEFRIYYKSWYTAFRLISYTFSTGACLVDKLTHVVDSLSPYGVIGFRYTADAAGTASVRVQSHNASHGFHLYGLTNEEASYPAAGTLTVAPSAGADWTLSGPLGGCGALIKSGAGRQTLGSTATPLVSAQQGTLALGPNAVLAGGAEILAGGTLAADQGGGRITSLSGDGTLTVSSGDFCYLRSFNSDANCDISAAKVYTHKLDFGSYTSGPICGVTFTKTSAASGTANGYGWSGFPSATHSGNDTTEVNPTNSVHTLLRDMNYGIMNNGTMYLTGLTPGKRYEVRFYNRAWGGGNRGQILTFDPDGTGPKAESFQFNPDIPDNQANFVAYRYTAESSQLKIFLQAVNTNNMSLHLYGLTNEELPTDSPLQIETPAGTSSIFNGAATGYGTWSKTGGGSLTLTGLNSVSGALSVAAGSLIIADGGSTGAGAVSVAGGASACGIGSLGGNVTVASNALFHAGTPTACGTLAVGGSLTIIPGAQLTYRFAGGASNDTVTVNGLLTFPTNGVVQASALTTGASAPAKDVFFASTQVINGPADLSGWTVTGVEKASLKYSDDRKTIFFSCPRGTLLRIM